MNLAQLIEAVKAANGGTLPPGITEEALRATLTEETTAEISRQTEGLGIAGVVAKKNQLLNEKTRTEEELAVYKKLGKPEELKKLQKEKELDDGTHYDQERTRLEAAHQTEKTAWEEREKGLKATIEFLAIDAEILAGLGEGGVASGLTGAALAKWREDNKRKKIFLIEGEGEEVKGFAKTDMGNKPIREFIKGWLTGEEGKPFRAARDSKGGGAAGDKDDKPTETNPWAKDTLNYTEQGKIVKTDPAKAERLRAAAGVK